MEELLEAYNKMIKEREDMLSEGVENGDTEEVAQENQTLELVG
jgi:uncharacterized protein YqeY